MGSFTLSDGTFAGKGDYEPVYLSYLVYGDVTGDGEEEALVTLVLSVRGTAIPYINYIYSAEDGKPKLLWAFPNGDRADKGLRKIYGDNGTLVVERFSPVEKNGSFPKYFTRTRYRWRGKSFQEVETSELLPAENHSVQMTRYDRAEK